MRSEGTNCQHSSNNSTNNCCNYQLLRLIRVRRLCLKDSASLCRKCSLSRGSSISSNSSSNSSYQRDLAITLIPQMQVVVIAWAQAAIALWTTSTRMTWIAVIVILTIMVRSLTRTSLQVSLLNLLIQLRIAPGILMKVIATITQVIVISWIRCIWSVSNDLRICCIRTKPCWDRWRVRIWRQVLRLQRLRF